MVELYFYSSICHHGVVLNFTFTYASYKKLTPRLRSLFCLRMRLALRVVFSKAEESQEPG
jgi:hypothetical protein